VPTTLSAAALFFPLRYFLLQRKRFMVPLAMAIYG
jgi:hypothetical protein